jgi:hypothetical protein
VSAPIRGQFGEDLANSIRDRLAPLEVVSASHVFGDDTAVLTELNVGDVVVAAWVQVLTAYNAASTNVLVLGNEATDDKFIAAAGITEGTPGVYPTATFVPGTAETVVSDLVLTYTQSGTAASTGASKAYAVIARASTMDADAESV